MAAGSAAHTPHGAGEGTPSPGSAGLPGAASIPSPLPGSWGPHLGAASRDLGGVACLARLCSGEWQVVLSAFSQGVNDAELCGGSEQLVLGLHQPRAGAGEWAPRPCGPRGRVGPVGVSVVPWVCPWSRACARLPCASGCAQKHVWAVGAECLRSLLPTGSSESPGCPQGC